MTVNDFDVDGNLIDTSGAGKWYVEKREGEWLMEWQMTPMQIAALQDITERKTGLDETVMALNTQPNLFEPGKRYFRAFSPGDDFYEALIETHRDLSDEQSEMVNARLILLLANHIGDIAVLREAMSIARAGVVAKD